MALLIAAAAANARRTAVWAAAIAALALCAVLLAHGAWWDSDGVNDLYKSILVQGQGYFGTDEYGVRGSDHYDLDPKAARVVVSRDENAPTQAKIHTERWRAERKVFTVNSGQPVTVVLRLMSYPAWSVWINGQPAATRARPNTKEVEFDVPRGNSRVEVRFTRTPDRTLGAAISLSAVAAWLLLTFLERRRRLST